MIEPVILKGFRDSLPNEEIPKRKIITILESIFQSYGFVPIDTPVLEYTSVLLGKGGGETDKQVFHFLDNGGREVAMRFDLTVPFARFMASHTSEVALPFKRYHINKVWRGEKPQKGRYREFYQCDFDIVGIDSEMADYEILSMMNSSFASMDIKGYTFHLSHRGLFNTFLEKIGERDNSVEILRAVDKLRKIGEDEVRTLLREITSSEEKAEAILKYITADKGSSSFLMTLDRLTDLIGEECESAKRLKAIYSLLEKTGISGHFTLDPSITRGLDYYTGIVYETFLSGAEEIGSVCSGGRYNNLASLYTKENLPGVGSSIGLDRLIAALEELKSPLLENRKSSDILIIYALDKITEAETFATELRKNGIKTDVYLSPEPKMKRVYDYLDKNSIPYLLSLSDKATLRDQKTRESVEVNTPQEVLEKIKA